MISNNFQRKKIKESYEVFQCPDGLVLTKLPGKLTQNRWVYRDNPWTGIGRKECRDKIIIWDNLFPWGK